VTIVLFTNGNDRIGVQTGWEEFVRCGRKFGRVLEEEVIQLYAREILLALKYLHENEIVHCDLKWLKEFKAKGVRAAGSWQSIGGTPLWMAPEVLRDEGMDFASDLWSLGCTVVEMGTGRPPWSDDEISNPMAAVLKIACSSGKPKFPTKFSNEGVDFLDKCFKRDPKRRWTA